MADQQQSTPDQNRAVPEKLDQNTPGSQSSSGMTDRLDDSLIEAFERDKQRRGEELDVPESALGNTLDAAGNPLSDGSPINRDPEATTGPVTD